MTLMKSLLCLSLLLATIAAKAQPTNAPASPPATNSVQPLQVQTTKGAEAIFALPKSAENVLTLKVPAANEIIRGRITYSGIAVEAAKVGNPLELLNPLAPVEYGSPEDNVVRDPINGRVRGLKIFAIRF
jgi:hypothetical protein